jgi:biotin operon repressor
MHHVVNDTTGAVDFPVAYVVPKHKKILGEPFMLMFQNALVEVSKNRALTGTDRRVLFYMIGVMEYENLVRLTQRQIAEELQSSQQEVSKSIQKLYDEGYLMIDEIYGSAYIYKISEDLVWKGKTENREKVTARKHRR